MYLGTFDTSKTRRTYASKALAIAKVRATFSDADLEMVHWFVADTVDGRFVPVFFVRNVQGSMWLASAIARHGWPCFN